MRNFEGYVKTSKLGSDVKFSFEMEDDATEEEIEAVAMEVMLEKIEWNFNEKE